MRALDEAVLLYPVYALLFADSGLSGGEISSLFVIWSVASFTLDVPSGAWADTYSRPRLLAAGAVLRSIGFALWVVHPTYWSFALGFVLWGMRSAFESGTSEALLYDELKALGAEDRYATVLGRSGTVSMVAMMVAVALASPVFALGGYELVGAASVAVGLANAIVALSLPARAAPPPRADGVSAFAAYLHTLRSGLGEVRRNVPVRRAAIVAALVFGFGAVDEYVGLLARAMGVATALVPFAYALPALAMAVGSALAGRAARVRPSTAGIWLAVGAVGLLVGAGSQMPVGMLGVTLCYGFWQILVVVSNTRLQEQITGSARATVLSVSGIGAEMSALLVYITYGIASSAGAPVAPLVAGFAVPLLATAVLVWRWLPKEGRPVNAFRGTGTPY